MQQYEVIIAGGSYAGLSAAMALGRAIRNVLVIDGGDPCNRQTPHSHNFITQDGETPAAIAQKARAQVAAYPTVQFLTDIVTDVQPSGEGFAVTTAAGKQLEAKKILFATGMKDVMPDIAGFAECWGITAVHCPYCHGYEIRGLNTGILANGDMAFEFGKLIRNWTDKLTIFTNGPSTLQPGQATKLAAKGISINEQPIAAVEHVAGVIKRIVFKDTTTLPLEALYAKIPMHQKCPIPEALGCQLDEHGFIVVDFFSKTNVPGVYAAGDNTTMMRSVAAAVAGGTKAGAMINKELVDEGY
ncbi:NAD(P)/FAD-dependent oxidoreductase [Chitinophaga horti]|uniref:NAD(P)/FAD-dependent oxidoreductase n=1 Tax=Chitinophaga horti TaxID=2920382 RepID=A0ABY6J6J9_9BACT|nr:NAD(P)/FAD-dependent oxidoreductase [Chitinophaga horti]UYQ95303.1 NAD(P)/FAD-dependent oxidoreductase [Chitinophaga horti]